MPAGMHAVKRLVWLYLCCNSFNDCEQDEEHEVNHVLMGKLQLSIKKCCFLNFI